MKTLLSVDEKLTKFEEVKKTIIERRNILRAKAGDDPTISLQCGDRSGKGVR